MNEAGKLPAEDIGRIEAPWINKYTIEEVTRGINEEFTLAIGKPLTKACSQLSNHCLMLKDDRDDDKVPGTTARGTILEHVIIPFIAPARTAMSEFMSHGTKSQFLEVSVGTLVHNLKLPTVGKEEAQEKFRQARIEAAKTKSLLDDVEGFFKELHEEDEETL